MPPEAVTTTITLIHTRRHERMPTSRYECGLRNNN